MSIVVLSDNVGMEYVSRIERAAIRAGRDANMPVSGENIYGTGRDVAMYLDDTTAGGFILTPPLADDRQVLSMLEAKRKPYVRFAPLLDAGRGSSVSMDEFDAARAITAHLLERGHRRVALLRGPRVHLVSMRRYNGYAAALGGKNLRIDPALIAEGDFSRTSGREHAAALFAARPTAIFASNDEMAIGIIEAARAAGIAVPGDISIVGFDDNAAAKTCSPRLTTVRQPLEEMAEAAVNLLSEAMRLPSRGPRDVTVPYEIMVRDSVAAPPG